MQVQPYLFFNGRCEEAIEFYRDTLGAEVTMLMRFKEMPDADAHAITPENENKIMHANLRVGQSEFMASDGRNTGETNFEGFSLSVAVSDDAEAERLFGLLSESGDVRMPMAETFFASRFGAVDDKFGVSWMILSFTGEKA
jgi:PhnB protein